MPLFAGFVQLGAGLSVGLAGLAAGFAIGIVGDAGVRGTAQQPRLFVGMVRVWLGTFTIWSDTELVDRFLSLFSRKSWVFMVRASLPESLPLSTVLSVPFCPYQARLEISF